VSVVKFFCSRIILLVFLLSDFLTGTVGFSQSPTISVFVLDLH